MLSITKASLRSIVRNPSAVVFNLVFPLIFIIVFGFISGGGFKIDVALEKGSVVDNFVYQSLTKIGTIHLIQDKPLDAMNTDLDKGSIDAVVRIQKNDNGNLDITLKTTKASPERGSVFKMMLSQIIDKQNLALSQSNVPKTELKEEIVEGRKYSTIDFILPGQLGFSFAECGRFRDCFYFYQLKADARHQEILCYSHQEGLYHHG